MPLRTDSLSSIPMDHNQVWKRSRALCYRFSLYHPYRCPVNRRSTIRKRHEDPVSYEIVSRILLRYTSIKPFPSASCMQKESSVFLRGSTEEIRLIAGRKSVKSKPIGMSQSTFARTVCTHIARRISIEQAKCMLAEFRHTTLRIELLVNLDEFLFRKLATGTTRFRSISTMGDLPENPCARPVSVRD
jgi:hypothetical protein